jgi:hypothetical protein
MWWYKESHNDGSNVEDDSIGCAGVDTQEEQ